MPALAPHSGSPTARQRIEALLNHEASRRLIYAPNYWQWFTHHHHHHLLPESWRDCDSQLDLIRRLGLDVFSRNLYCDPTCEWFGGLAEAVFEDVQAQVVRRHDGRDVVIEKTFRTRAGTLTERRRFLFAESTLVQEKFLLEHFDAEATAFEQLVAGRRWRFNASRFQEWQQRVGQDGVVIAGELFSPLKMLHLAAGAANAVFLLQDHPERCAEWMHVHEAAQLDLVQQMLAAGVPVMMAMDNLDSTFHPPRYLERYSARFYEQSSRLCHQAGAAFFIHACGRQKANLPLIASLGVDGLEGVAYPPLGDVSLDEAMQLSGDRLIITGGISAMETERFQTRDEVRRYLDELLGRLKPWRHRFVLSASCNTSIRTSWEVLSWFRDAWREAAY